MNKNKLKRTNKKLNQKVKHLERELRLVRSDFLVELEKLSCRTILAEMHVKTLTKENCNLRVKLENVDGKESVIKAEIYDIGSGTKISQC